MENIVIPGTCENPTIDFNFEKGLFKITGRLISIKSTEHQIFVPLFEKIKRYALKPAPESRISIDLEFCSSSGIKNIFQLLKIFDQVYQNGNDVLVEWRFFIDDEDGKDKGLYFKKLLSLPVKLVMYSNE